MTSVADKYIRVQTVGATISYQHRSDLFSSRMSQEVTGAWLVLFLGFVV